jgi:protease PrsW
LTPIATSLAISYGLAFLPVLAFLAALRLLDSYKLVPRNRILLSLLAGGAAAMLCYKLNALPFQYFPTQYPKFGAPIVEELTKAIYWIFLILTARAAFMVDSGICAFAIGAGFALVENAFYLQNEATSTIAVSLLRGFGTAFMHGGVAAIGAMLSVFLSEQKKIPTALRFLPGLGAAILIHEAFNQGIFSPAIAAAVMIVTMPILITAVFLWGESSLRRWLGDKLDEDIDLLEKIAQGQLLETPAGTYLQTLQDRFPAPIVGDMLCLLHLTVELSVRSKGDLLLKEAGLEVPPDPDLDAQFQEMAFLVKSIGPTGMRALTPLLSKTPRDLWEIRRLASQS